MSRLVSFTGELPRRFTIASYGPSGAVAFPFAYKKLKCLALSRLLYNRGVGAIRTPMKKSQLYAASLVIPKLFLL